MEFVTPRLRVRPFSPEDEGALHRLLSDPAVMRWLEPPFSLAQTQNFLRQAGLCQPPLVYAAELLSTNSIIGYIIYHPYTSALEYELGWVLDKARWGQGIASELTEGMLRQARSQGLHGVVLECLPQNTATRRIAARFGFSFAGIEQGLEQYRLLL